MYTVLYVTSVCIYESLCMTRYRYVCMFDLTCIHRLDIYSSLYTVCSWCFSRSYIPAHHTSISDVRMVIASDSEESILLGTTCIHSFCDTCQIGHPSSPGGGILGLQCSMSWFPGSILCDTRNDRRWSSFDGDGIMNLRWIYPSWQQAFLHFSSGEMLGPMGQAIACIELLCTIVLVIHMCTVCMKVLANGWVYKCILHNHKSLLKSEHFRASPAWLIIASWPLG